jgi:hypothetical protein
MSGVAPSLQSEGHRLETPSRRGHELPGNAACQRDGRQRSVARPDSSLALEIVSEAVMADTHQVLTIISLRSIAIEAPAEPAPVARP